VRSEWKRFRAGQRRSGHVLAQRRVDERRSSHGELAIIRAELVVTPHDTPRFLAILKNR
jgi:hypothetical protein